MQVDKKRKKLSGHQYKVKRLENQTRNKKLSNNLRQFLNKNQPCTASSASTTIESIETSSAMQSAENKSDDDKYSLHPSPRSTSQYLSKMDEDLHTSCNNLDDAPAALDSNIADDEIVDAAKLEISSDPAMWHITSMTDGMRQMLVEKGPFQVKHLNFPEDSSKRHFSSFHYTRTLKNGETVERPWLMYSIKNDSIFCFCCMLFDLSAGKHWSKNGYSDWKNLTRTLTSHELSKPHKTAFKKWNELDTRLKTKKTIDHEYQRLKDLEIQHWRNVLKRIISVIRMMSAQCLALRGSTEQLFQPNNGNFLKIIELLSEFDPVMEEHVRRIQSKSEKWSISYLSNTIQDELIQLMGKQILTEIVRKVKEARYFSIIVDCTPDLSHKEQLSLILRTVCLNTSTKQYKCEEFFAGFFEAFDTTGEGLTALIMDRLEELGLDFKNMRGQGYDNGSNMKGAHKGVQNRILSRNPRAFFVPCAAHSMNLVVNDAAACSGEISAFFSIIQELYVFFSVSPKRWTVLVNELSANSCQLTLKPLSTTRWSSRIDAVKPVRYQIGAIYDALMEFIEDNAVDVDTKNKANGLARKIKDYKFICSVILWYDILYQINKVSLLMQSPTLNLEACVQMLDSVMKFLQSYRCNGFAKMLVSAREMAEELEIEPEFKLVEEIRGRRKKRQFDYEARDEAPLSEKVKFEVSFFNFLIDVTLNSMEERFLQLRSHSNNFRFLYDIYNIKNMNDTVLKANCDDLHLVLKDGEDCDVDAVELREELSDLCKCLPRSMEPVETLNHLISTGYDVLYPNTVIALRILITLPVTVASGERSFSKLKLIKTYLRSTLGQTKLSSLALLTIESEIAAGLDYSELISNFAKQKVRRVHF